MNMKNMTEMVYTHLNRVQTFIENETPEFKKTMDEALDITKINSNSRAFVAFLQYWSDINLLDSNWIDERIQACKNKMNDLLPQIPNDCFVRFINVFSGVDWVMTLFDVREDYADEIIDRNQYFLRIFVLFNLLRAYGCCLAIAEERGIYLEDEDEEKYRFCLEKLKNSREDNVFDMFKGYILALSLTMKEDKSLLTERLGCLVHTITGEQ